MCLGELVNIEEKINIIKGSAYFDLDWYVSLYPDVSLINIDAAEHYIKYGARMGRDPGPDFNTKFYVDNCPDIHSTGENPLLHYLVEGEKRGHEIRPSNAKRYLKPRNNAFARPEPVSAPSKSKRRTAHPVTALKEGAHYDEAALRREYVSKSLNTQLNTFVLYRIIGNDLIPRHAKGQSRQNVQFVLENEPALKNCKRLWVVNRIIDPSEKAQIIRLLDAHGQDYIDIPFNVDEYRNIGWDFDALPSPGFLSSQTFQKLGPEQKMRVRTALYRLKNLYVMNNNGARNAALRAGRSQAKWVLPWDGNCFVTEKAWEDITDAVISRPYLKYFAVPMERISDNALLLSEDFTPDPVEEPQLIFRADSAEEFNEGFPYGRRPKVELFWRLNMPGPWDRWKDDPWDQTRRETAPEAGAFGVAGWVARMFSGVKALEQQNDKASFKNRGLVRQDAIVAAIDHVDRLMQNHDGLSGAIFYRDAALSAAAEALTRTSASSQTRIISKIIADAEAALGRGPYSVVDKTTLPPSGERRDYWHPAPYWWPNPDTADGFPYIKKDGQRVPGTRLDDPESDKYDRTRLQRMFDESLALALAWKLTGRAEFAEHGARLARTWFIEPDKGMNPHLTYAQVRMGHNRNQGVATGIIEFKDLYYLFDAIRFFEQSGAFTAEDSAQLKSWMTDYLNWLETSVQGVRECRSVNNHGTYYDLQTAAICAYLEDWDKLRDIILRAQSRLFQQITKEGEQPDEMTRPITQHYVFFNLQGLLNIFRIASAAGHPPLDCSKPPASLLKAALKWILRHDLKAWPYQQIDSFDHDRVFPLISAALEIGVIDEVGLMSGLKTSDLAKAKSIFDPHYAINPYWNLIYEAQTSRQGLNPSSS